VQDVAHVALGALQLRTHRLAALQLAVKSTASAMHASMSAKVNSPSPQAERFHFLKMVALAPASSGSAESAPRA
jgi:hypothetical protein